jgi:hypothetical protein
MPVAGAGDGMVLPEAEREGRVSIWGLVEEGERWLVKWCVEYIYIYIYD